MDGKTARAGPDAHPLRVRLRRLAQGRDAARADHDEHRARLQVASAGWACWAKSSTRPFLPICRCQIDIKFNCSSQLLAERMPGFHWMTVYGDYTKELGYALRRVGIKWELLG